MATEPVAGAQPTSDSAALTTTQAAAGATAPAAALTTQQAAATTTQGVATATEQVGAIKPVVLTLPTNAGAFVDEGDLREIEALAKREGWSQEDAQAHLAEQVTARQGATAAMMERAKAHTEIGGANLEAAQTNARAFMDHFLPANTPDGEELRRGLTKLGLANYPPLVVLFARAGKAMAEDSPAFGSTKSGASEKTAEDRLYGTPAAATT